VHGLAPLERLELSPAAPEADALSAELQGRTREFYHACCATYMKQIGCRRSVSQTPVSRRSTSSIMYAGLLKRRSLVGSMRAIVSLGV
jgi:hypothetical protein